MNPKPRSILLNTVGTSLFHPNLEGLAAKLADPTLADPFRSLAEAYRAADWEGVAAALAQLPGDERTCGAEINSVASLVARNYVTPDCGLFFYHSATEKGRQIAQVLVRHFTAQGHRPVEAIEIEDLQDTDPKRFRTHGLRNLARQLCKAIRERSAAACAINATGGYKAQVAIGVLLGQALGVPVYYKHELFSEIIAFPPMPVALDFEVWMRASGMLSALERSKDPLPAADYAEEWDEKFESLVERVSIDDAVYLELSATGQIFHETFRERFRSSRDQFLPPPAAAKHEPVLEKSGWPGEHPDVGRFLKRLTSDVPQVVRCATVKLIGKRLGTRFKVGQDCVEGIYDNGKIGVLFRVETTAQTSGQQAAVVAFLNDWLSSH